MPDTGFTADGLYPTADLTFVTADGFAETDSQISATTDGHRPTCDTTLSTVDAAPVDATGTVPPLPTHDGDRHIRRTGQDYARAFADLLPQGVAWPRDPESVLQQLVGGQSEIWGETVDARAADLLERESDPRAVLEMLEDWERAFGLPDPCVDEALTIEERRLLLLQRITEEGGQSRAFFYALAARLGYVIRIVEYSPFMCGLSRCGDTRPTGMNGEQYRWEIGPPEVRFYWTVRVYGSRLSWFRMGSGQCGVDPMVRFSLATDLECLFRRYKPAHTEIVFDYANVRPRYLEYVPFLCGVHRCGTDPMLTIIEHGGDPLPAESVPLY